MQISKDLAHTLNQELRAAVEEIAKRHGLVVASHIKCRFSSNDVRFAAVELAVPPSTSESAPAAATTPEAVAFTREAWRFGLKPEHLGVTVTVNVGRGPEPGKITGLLPKGKKYPIVIDLACGRRKVALKPVVDGLVAAGLISKEWAAGLAV
jgi:hypothetical protein